MAKYEALIDGGELGDTIIEAENKEEALEKAEEWARDVDWPEEGCEIDIHVTNIDNADDQWGMYLRIESKEEKLNNKVEEDGKVIAEMELEYSTKKIVIIDREAFYIHENGGARGSYDRQNGDGVWRERPVENSRPVTKREVICYMLDWGYELSEVAEVVKELVY